MSARDRGADVHPADLPDAPAAACRGGHDPDLWFPVSESRVQADVRRAIALCERCPLVDACRQYATDRRLHGIWGASTTQEREATRPKRPGGWQVAPLLPCPSEAAARRHQRRGQRCDLCSEHVSRVRRERAESARMAAAS